MLRLCSFYNLMRVFDHKPILNFVKISFCIYQDDFVIFKTLFANVVSHWLICKCWTRLVNLVVVYNLFLSVIGCSFLEFCWELLHQNSSMISVCNFLCWWHHCLILVPGWWSFKKYHLEYSFLFTFLEGFVKYQHNYSLYVQ